jgi:hypothetical protein
MMETAGIGSRSSVTLLVLVLALAGIGCNAPQQPAEEQPAEQTAPPPENATPAPRPQQPESRKDASPAAEAPAPAPAPEPAPQIVQVEIPSGTVLELELLTPLDSSVNRAGDEIQAKTLSPLYVEGKEVLDAGAYVEGRVTDAQASGRVKGRARLAFTFDRLKTPTGIVKIHTSYVEREAESGKKKDTAVIGGAAGVGAIVGAIIGGKKGAAIGATVGGAGGAGVVLSTKGEEIRLPVGVQMNVRLDEPITLELR